MPYKDPDKQREANRERQRRYKARQKALPEQGVTEGVTNNEPIPQGWEDEISDNLERTGNIEGIVKRGKDIKCFADLPPDVQATIERISESPEEKRRRTGIAIHYQHVVGRYEPNSDQEFTKLMANAKPGHVKVSKPGDDDYVPMCETTRAFVKAI